MRFSYPAAIFTLSALPRKWQIAGCFCAGAVIGCALLIARISNAVSYISDEPDACINCHVMTDAYVSWQRGSHGHVAVCTDCHVPHHNVVAKYAFKARDGARHSYVFTVGGEPQVLKLSRGAVPVVQSNCVRCHSERVSMIRLAGSSERKCWQCHTGTHGDVAGLSASPAVLRPQLPPAGLPLMQKGIK